MFLQVNTTAGLSPGKESLILGKRRDTIITRRRNASATPAVKKRRLQLKAERNRAQASNEVCEGTTYQPCVEMSSATDEDITEIPAPINEPVVQLIAPSTHTEIYFDLETTGLGIYLY